jgi:CRISPR-associated endonuclease/helicase Cas3
MPFAREFALLTGHPPFPWQEALSDEFAEKRIRRTYDIPTGLGKTSIIPIWLLALAHHAAKATAADFPRRLVYVVNRRTVVDQATREAERIREALRKPQLRHIADALRSLAVVNGADPVAISTLRGEFADNAEWRVDPARPAIVLGTVDMIGSRLLFSAYGRGFKSRPLHAGFVGQDSFVVHDEAHLEPAFQSLLEKVQAEQTRCRELKPMRVAALTATSRDGDESGDVFRLTKADRAHDIVKARIHARKGIKFWPVTNQKSLADAIADRALAYKDSGQAILVFVRKLHDFDKIVQRLTREQCEPEVLTGTMRGLERDRLEKSDRFARFVAAPTVAPRQGTVYLVCTSAGEVGIDMSADRLVCDLTPFDSMAQRFGRVNRFGAGDASIDIVYAPVTDDKEDNEFDRRCERTRALLEQLPLRSDRRRNASPAALANLPAAMRRGAFSPEPEIPAVTDILFDAWSLTTVRDRMPGRPPVADWLHGVAEWEAPETSVAWRGEVSLIAGLLRDRYAPDDLLDDFPLKPHELLRDRSDRVLVHLKTLAERHADTPVWLLDADGLVTPTTLSQVAGLEPDSLADCTVVLPPEAGGLTEQGMFDGATAFTSERADRYDVADRWMDERQRVRRCRVWDDEEPPDQEMRRVRTIDLRPETSDEDEETRGPRYWHWYVRPGSNDDEISRLGVEQRLDVHHDRAGTSATQLAARLDLPVREASAVIFAARYHDAGKDREVWQRSIWNSDFSHPLAKSGNRRPLRDLGSYRHEFGSLLDAVTCPEWRALDLDAQDLALHLKVAHHGRARPHFPAHEAFDPERSADDAVAAACETPRRFARLQRRYGRWGLAYLESLVRAADALASSIEPSAPATTTVSLGAQVK